MSSKCDGLLQWKFFKWLLDSINNSSTLLGQCFSCNDWIAQKAPSSDKWKYGKLVWLTHQPNIKNQSINAASRNSPSFWSICVLELSCWIYIVFLEYSHGHLDWMIGNTYSIIYDLTISFVIKVICFVSNNEHYFYLLVLSLQKKNTYLPE